MNPNLDVFNKENFDFEAFNDVNFEGTLETFTVFVPTDVVNLTKVQDDYDYDMETSHNIFFWDELLPTLIVYCLTFVLGLVGNVLIIFTIFRYRKMKSTTNVFLASLASSDLLLILFCIPVKSADVQRLIREDEAERNEKTGRALRKMAVRKKLCIREFCYGDECIVCRTCGNKVQCCVVQKCRQQCFPLKVKTIMRQDCCVPRTSCEPPPCCTPWEPPAPTEFCPPVIECTTKYPKGLVCKDEAEENGRTGMVVRKMERKKKEKKDSPKKFSIEERFRKWHFPGRNFKENTSKDTSDAEKDKKPRRKPGKQKSEDGREHVKSPKRSFPFLEVKTFLTYDSSRLTTKDPNISGKEERRKKKKKEKETAMVKREVPGVPCFTKSSEPIDQEELKYYTKKDRALREKKRRLERPKKRRKNDKYEMVKVVHPSFEDFEKTHESGGKTVVIYHRQNRKYLHRHARDGHPFEQVSFMESCQTTVEPIESKRGFSEPRKKDYYVAHRRTRFPVEPFKMVSPDFRTAIDFFKQTNGSFEYNKFEDITNSHHVYKNSNSRVHKLSEPKSTSDLAELPLENIAEKKLNLHRELIRSENYGKKKFWDSIDKSLNYRCALAEMFSTQSFLTKESSFLHNSNVLPKANIYVRESVISSYHVSSGDLPSTINSFQGFGRFQTSPLQITQPLTTFRTLLIKENSENDSDLLLRNKKFRSRSTNDSVSAYQLWDESESLPVKESSLERDSQLESLMSKLSEEITKCSCYLRKLEEEKSNDSPTYENTAPLNWKTAKSPIFVYSTTEMKFDGHDKIIHTKDTDIVQSKPTTSTQKNEIPSNDYSSKSPQKTDSLSTDLTKDSQKTEKSSDNLKSMPTDSTSTHSSIKEKQVSKSDSLGNEERISTRNDISNADEPKSSKLGPVYLDEFTCCKECNKLKVKIIKLQRELEKLEKKMPFYPKEYQESVRECLESLHMTSDTFLKRMKSCAKLRQRDKSRKHHRQTHSKRTLSAPAPVIHEYRKKSFDLGQSNSDYRMNVGLEIKMENVDPVTGKKLHPPTKEGFQQEGNVKCRLFQDGKKPLLVLDTDFLYSPEKGMLFGKKDESLSTDLIIPLSKASKPEPFRQFQYVTLKPETHQCQNCVNVYPEPVNSEDLFDVYSINDSKRSLSKECIKKPKETKQQMSDNRPKTVSFSTRKPEKPCSLIPILRRPLPPTFPKTWASRNSSSSTVTIFPAEIGSGQFASVLKLAKLFSFTWTFGFFLCKLVHYMQSVSAICSVLTLTAMSLERYYAIVHPMKAQYICTISQARRIITATWVSAFLLAVPILFAQVHLRVGVKVEAYWCVRDWDNKVIWRAHELYMMLLILVLPTGVMAVAYTAICCEIWEVMQRRQDMTSGKGHGICKKARLARNSSNDSFPSPFCTNSTRVDRRRGWGFLKKELTDDGASVKQVIKMLVAVVVIYVICWGPMLIDNVLQAYGILSHIRMGWLKYMGTTFHLMAYFNSCINPIIYGFMSKNFRESFRKTLCCWEKKPKTANRSFSISQTRNTSIRYAESSFGRNTSIALPV